MEQTVEAWLTPTHSHPFESLLNQPLAGTFGQAAANGQTRGLELVIVNMIFMRLQVVVQIG